MVKMRKVAFSKYNMYHILFHITEYTLFCILEAQTENILIFKVLIHIQATIF